MVTTTTTEPLPSRSHAAVIQRAIDAVGVHEPANDYKLEPEQHARRLESDASGLRSILETDAVVRQTRDNYKSDDAQAVVARRRFEFAISVVSLVAITAMMAALFLVSVPPETTFNVRIGLALAAAGIVVAFLSCLAKVVTLERGHARWLVWIMRLVLTGVIAWAVYKFIPVEFAGIAQPTQKALTLVLLVCVVAADFITGGATARIFRRRSMRSAWYEARGMAEANRRQLFMAVLNAESSVSDGAGPVPLLCQKLEYFRRYQIEVQQSYFATRSHESTKSAGGTDLARFAAFAAFVLMGLALGITISGKLTEQGYRWSLPDSGTAHLVNFMLDGWDDLAVLTALFALGSYGYLQIRSTLLRERANHLKFANSHSQLRQATSSEPGKPNLDLPTPLTFARKAAVRGERGVVEHFFRDVNRQLAVEVGDWNAMTPYTIVTVGTPPVPRLFSADPLDPDHDFGSIVQDLTEHGVKPIRARKIGFVAARPASQGEEVETRFDGKESTNTARSGDWIVTNMDSTRKIIHDRQNCVNTYIVPGEGFSRLYERDTGSTEFGEIYKAKGVIDAIKLAGGFDIVGPWGKRQVASSGYLARSGKDVYGIYDTAFEQTYELLP